MSECVPGQIAGFGVGAGRVWSRSPYVVTPQIKKMKVSALQRQMDAVTHTCAKKSRVRRQFRNLAADQMPSETGGKE